MNDVYLLAFMLISVFFKRSVLTKLYLLRWNLEAILWVKTSVSVEFIELCLRVVTSVQECTSVLYVAGTLWSSQYVLLDVFGEEYIVQYLSTVTGLKFFSFLHFLGNFFLIIVSFHHRQTLMQVQGVDFLI